MEIFNPTTDEIDLKDYFIGIYHNGSSSPTIVELTGTVAAKDVYVVAYSDCSSRMLAVADQLSDAYFPNGNDAIALLDVDANVLDVIGEIGVDPGSAGWAVANDAGYPFLDGSTNDHTLARIPYALNAETDWSVAEHEWVALPLDTLHFLGSHGCPCRNSQIYTMEITNLTFTNLNSSYDEDFCGFNESCIIFEVKVSPYPISSGDWVYVQIVPDFCSAPAIISTDYKIFDFNFSQNDLWQWNINSLDGTQRGYIQILNDSDVEPDEGLCIELQSTDATCGGTCTLSTVILDDDGVSIESLMAKTGLEIFPNPASNTLTLRNVKGVNNITIVNNLGQAFHPEKSSSTDVEQILNIDGLTDGLYNLRFSYKSAYYSYKFVKE